MSLYRVPHGWRSMPVAGSRTRRDDPFLQAAIEEARQGLAEGGIPIGSVIVHRGAIIGRGHNRRVQKGSVILHGEMDAPKNAGRQLPACTVNRSCIRRCPRARCAAVRSCSMASPRS